MGSGLLTPPATGELDDLADATGFIPDRLEKTVRLLALADEIAAHPYLGGRLALTGGTALNMFVLAVPRLSFDLDFNYVGSVDRATMKAERPEVEDALAGLLPDHGLRVKRQPNQQRDHAGGKWDLRYRNAWGRSESLSVDVSYVRRVPLWPTVRLDSRMLGRWQAARVLMVDVHEIAAGKLSALYDRGYPRDLFDVGLIPDIPGLEPAKLRIAFVVYGAGATDDWRGVCQDTPTIQARALARQLRSALTRTDAQRTRPIAADAYLTELQTKAAPAQQMVVPFTPSENAFLDMVLDRGNINPQLLTADTLLQQRITAEPWLRWKARRVRTRLARQALQLSQDSPPYLEVRPAADQAWDWTLAVCDPDGTPVATSAKYPAESEAVDAGGFALEVVRERVPLRFEEWEHGWEYGHRPPGEEANTVRPVPVPGGWQLHAYRPDGNMEAASHTYPTHQVAAQAQNFLRVVAKARPGWLEVVRDCGCEQRGATCRHQEVVVAAANPVSVVVRPHRKSKDGWELVVRGGDGSPLRVSDPYPSEAHAVGTRDFALRVANGEYPIRFEGWNPQEWQGAPGYVPPPIADTAVTVRVVSPPPPVTGDWRLEARRSNGYVVVTSHPYPTYPSAAGALDFVGSLSAFAGDPQRTGRVKDTTLPDDRVCDCRSLGQGCLHFGIDRPDICGSERDDRGPYLSL